MKQNPHKLGTISNPRLTGDAAVKQYLDAVPLEWHDAVKALMLCGSSIGLGDLVTLSWRDVVPQPKLTRLSFGYGQAAHVWVERPGERVRVEVPLAAVALFARQPRTGPLFPAVAERWSEFRVVLREAAKVTGRGPHALKFDALRMHAGGRLKV